MYTKQPNIPFGCFAQESMNSRGKFRFAKQILTYINMFSRNRENIFTQRPKNSGVRFIRINRAAEPRDSRRSIAPSLGATFDYTGIEQSASSSRTANRWPAISVSTKIARPPPVECQHIRRIFCMLFFILWPTNKSQKRI